MNRVLSLVIDREPTNLSIEDLASLLNLLAKALHAADPDVSSEYSLSYSLVDIERGSTALDYVANNPYIGEQQALKMTQQMADPITRRSVKPYQNFQDKCNELNTTISFFPGNSKKPTLYLVPEPPPIKKTIRGKTTIYGVLEKVGGSFTTSASVRQPRHEKATTVYLSKELAKNMAPLLYQGIRLDGEARWDLDNLEIIDFTVSHFSPHGFVSPGEIIDRLAEVTDRGVWHQTNQSIEEYLRDLRGKSGDWS